MREREEENVSYAALDSLFPDCASLPGFVQSPWEQSRAELTLSAGFTAVACAVTCCPLAHVPPLVEVQPS